MTDTVVLCRIVVEVHVSKATAPDSDEAWLAGDWEAKFDDLRNAIEIATFAGIIGTTITVD